ncbi:gamma-aminobutyric acid type B receptor subunit 1-like [Glandiceps talaboti]
MYAIVQPVWGDKSPLYIGGLLESIGTTGVSPAGDIAIEKALDFIHRQPSLIPDYQLIVLKNYTKIDSILEGEALHIMYDFIYNKPQLVLILDVSNSIAAKPTNQLSTVYNLIQLMKELVSILRSRDGYHILTVELVEDGIESTAQIQSLKAYRTGQYGKKYVWILLGWLATGWYRDRFEEGVDITCTDDEMVSVLNGHIAIKMQSYALDFNDVDFHGLKPEPQDIKLFEDMKSSSSLYYAGFTFDAMIGIAIALNQTQRFLSQLEHPRRLSDFTYDDEHMAAIIKDNYFSQLNF